MSIDIRLPNINGTTEKEQLVQIRSYLYQFAEQMNWAMKTIESGQDSDDIVVQKEGGLSSASSAEKNAASTFSEIKSLIIKSADIVNAYYDQIESMLDLSGKYVASSDFGDYKSETDQKVSASYDKIEQTFEKTEAIDRDMDGVMDMVKNQNAYIHYGLVGTTLDDTGIATSDAPGFEIGDFQTLEAGTVSSTTARYARFTAYGLELFGDNKEYPVAYIKQNKLFITNAEFTGTVIFGGYKVDTSNGLSFKWVGR